MQTENKNTTTNAVVKATNAKGEKINVTPALQKMIDAATFTKSVNSGNSKKELHKFTDEQKSETAKKAQRVKNRRNMDYLLFSIKDCTESGKFSESEIENNILSFIQYYQNHYNVNDFELSSFCNSNNEQKRKDYQVALNIIKEFISKVK